MQKQQRRWQYDWRQRVGERPTEQNAELFHSYVEYACQAIEDAAVLAACLDRVVRCVEAFRRRHVETGGPGRRRSAG